MNEMYGTIPSVGVQSSTPGGGTGNVLQPSTCNSLQSTPYARFRKVSAPAAPYRKIRQVLFRFLQEGREYWTVNYTGTQSF